MAESLPGTLAGIAGRCRAGKRKNIISAGMAGETFKQSTYERWLTTIIGEQNEKLGLTPIHINNLKLIKVSKHNNVLIIEYNAQLEKNWANIKKADFSFEFIDGVSNDSNVNELFSMMNRYVQRREELNNN